MPHVIEPAPSARARCRGCGEKIGAGELRFGESLPNPFAEGETLHWYHPECGAMKRPEPFLEAHSVQGETLPEADRLAGLARDGAAHPRLARVSGAERDPSGRALCRHCRQKLEKGAWRLVLVFWEEGRFTPAGFLHLPCAFGYFGTRDVAARLRRFSPGLTEADLLEIAPELAKASPAAAERRPGPEPSGPTEEGG